MSRERFIDPRIFRSPSFNRLSIPARLTFVGLIVTADDHGRGRGDPPAIRLEIFPGDNVTVEQVTQWTEEAAGEGMVRFYSVEGQCYYDLPKWDNYQRPKYKAHSKIPPNPNNGTQEIGEKPARISQNPPDSEEIRDGEGRGGEGSDADASASVSESSIPTGGGGTDQDGGEPSDLDVLRQHVAYFNQRVASVLKCPTIRSLTATRLRHLRCRLEEHPDLWDLILAEAPHLAEKFREGAAWLNFDFLMKPDSLAKYLDGNYRSKGKQFRKEEV